MKEAAVKRTQPTRRIALAKPARDGGELVEHALQLFDSMLWVFRGTMRSSWELAKPAEAHVVVVHHEESADTVAEWRRQGKHIVVLRTGTGATAGDAHTLVYPFPAAQVMSLLERLDAEIDGVAPLEAAPAEKRGSETGAPSALVETIRTIRTVRNAEFWLGARIDGAPLFWIRGDGAVYSGNANARNALRHGKLASANISVERVATPREAMTPYPGDELAWFAGYHASASPAAWIGEHAYKLIRWPDFGRLRSPDALTATCQLRVVSALDALPATAQELSKRARVTREQAARTLNALALCGFVEQQTTPNTPRVQFSGARPASGFRQFFRSLRKHLQGRSVA